MCEALEINCFPLRFSKSGHGLPSQGLTTHAHYSLPSKFFLAIIFSIILRKWILHFINKNSRGVSDGKFILLLDVLILGLWEMATGEWNNIKIIYGFFERKMGSFFEGWSYVCSNGYG